jgi:hypothetical protein
MGIRVCALICVLAGLATGANCQKTEVLEACSRFLTVPLPADIEGHGVPNEWPTCDSYHFYETGKFAKARVCAIDERAALFGLMERGPARPMPENAREYQPNLDGAMIVLALIYANGEGVSQNPRLAARFLCEADETNQVDRENEIPGMLKAFAQLGSMKTGGGKLVLCDHGIPPDGMPRTTYCDWQSEEEYIAVKAEGMLANEEGAQEEADTAKANVRALVKRLTPRQRLAYRKVVAALDAFLDKSMTASALYPPPRGGGFGHQDSSESYERAALYTTLAELIQTHPATPKAGEFEAADAELNRVYKTLMQFSGDGFTVEGMRDEERAWIVERDAIARFGATLDPKLPASAWKLQLTVARAKDLQSVHETLSRF